jgi:hypothetical protein
MGLVTVSAVAPTTDAAQRWQISIASGSIASATPLFNVTFGTQYRYADQTNTIQLLAPPVFCTNGTFYVTNVTSTGYTVGASAGFSGPQSFTIDVLVLPGVPVK